MKLENNNRRKIGKLTSICKRNSTLEQPMGQRRYQKGNEKKIS